MSSLLQCIAPAIGSGVEDEPCVMGVHGVLQPVKALVCAKYSASEFLIGLPTGQPACDCSGLAAGKAVEHCVGTFSELVLQPSEGHSVLSLPIVSDSCSVRCKSRRAFFVTSLAL